MILFYVFNFPANAFKKLKIEVDFYEPNYFLDEEVSISSAMPLSWHTICNAFLYHILRGVSE